MSNKDKLKSQESILLGQHIDADEEKLHLIEGGIEQVNEEVDEIVEEGKIEVTAKDKTLNKKVIARISTAIESSFTQEELVDACHKTFEVIVQMANTVQSSAIDKALKTTGVSIRQKIKEFTSGSEDAKVAAQNIFDLTIAQFLRCFSAIELASESGQLKLSFSGALALYSFASSFLAKDEKFTITYSEDLARCLVALTPSLTDNQSVFAHATLGIYTIISKTFQGYNPDSFISGILAGLASPVRFTYLSYVYQESNDINGLKSIGQKFNSLVMNDKEKQNFININFFLPYLTKVNEAIFRDVLFPEIDFMMKRGLSMVSLIGQTVKALTFKFNADLVSLLTSELFSDDYLVKEESIPEIKAYFSILGSKLDSKESGVALVVDFLFKRYQASKSSSSINIVQRLAFVRYLSASLKSFKAKDLVAEDHIKSIITAVLEHVFQIKEESAVKDTYSDLEQLLEQASSLSFIAESLKKLITKPLNIWHINLFTDLLDAKAKELGEVISVVAPQFKQMLSSENFKTTANFSIIIALTGFFSSAFIYTSDPSYLTWMIQNEGILGYFATKKGYVNTLGYFLKNPTQHDVKNHIKAITHFTQSHYSEIPLPTGDAQLRDILCHYILNEQYTFREHEIIECIQQISKSAGEKFVGNFVKSLFNKVKELAQIPPSYNREESAHKGSQSIPNKIKLALKYSLQEKKSDLTSDEFISLVKLISHPWVSSTNQSLLIQIRNLEELFPEGKLSNYFVSTQVELVDYAIRSRSGILSPDPVLRALAINIGVALSSQKLLTAFLDDIASIMNYKPLELAQKLEKIFLEEYERISFYDLMMYSEVSKDLLNVFKDRDAAVVKRELAVQQDAEAGASAGQGEQAAQEEEKEEAPSVDPAKLTAMLLKQAAAKKKAEAAKKPAGKPAAPVKAAAPAKKPQAKEEVPAHQPLDKEKRRQQDRDQIVNYLQEIQRIKGQQVTAALDIIKRSNQNNLQLDLTLNHLLMPLIKLLNYSATRFSTNICLHTLFEAHKLEPLFLVKNEIVSCLNAMSANRIYIKHMREFQVIFQHVQNRTQVSLFDKGYIQLVMMMANYVLKDLSVHLSVKEQALAVVQDILEDSNLVENIDLVIVTINMMKSSYNNENLAQYLNILLKRLTLEQLALILQRIFEYEPVPRMILLRELLEYELPLCCPVWFSTQIWILQFDEECGKLARKLWNKYGMVLRSGTLDLAQEGKASNMFFYLRSKNTNIFDNTIRGIVCAIEIFQNRYDLIVDDLIEFYNKEMKIIEAESLKASDAESGQTHAQNTVVVADERLNRMAVAEIIKRTAHMVGTNSFKKVFEFFITQGCLDQNEHVSKACMEASIQIITTKGPDYSDELLKILEKYINEKQKYSEVSKNQAIIMIGALANFLDNTAQQRLLGTFEKMLELLNSPSELIRQSICRVIPQLSRFFIDKSKKFLEDHLNILRTSADDKTIRGSAYAVSGIIKGLGLQNFLQMDLLNTIQKECFTKHADPMRKISGLYLYETLTISMGKVFEMYVEKILPNIIMCISDPKDQVRKCATQANRTVMSRLSNHAIKQVLPIFLKGLENDNWRSKLASVEALGNMAFCAPRQISGFLPHIVKGIREVLSDTHEKVHEAALQAIQNIGSVIKCPEIADILPTLVKALSNPNQFLKNAMKVLLDTSFVHAIDAPSLSLLIPILDSGLMMHDNESKHLASKLMGNICNLTQDPEDLLPYIKILMPAIKNSLFDSIPEIRASAAKALGSLSKGLGLENSSEMLTWLHSVLHQKQLHSSERSGAAQGFAEIISVHGVKFYEETIKLIVVKSQEPQSHIRESYRSVMVFLATCYDHFVKYLPKLLPLMIQGLSDDVEEVRKISLRNVKICIKLFGRQAPNQLVEPIMQMMFHRDFRVRQSSSVLMYQLVKELENDIIKSVPKYVSIETKNEILSSMFILKYDIIERVATQASQIWKNIIENQLKVLKAIINVLIKQIFDLIQNENMELQEMGLNCLRGICEKFGEKFVGDTIDILESYMERATSVQQTIAVTKGLYNMAFAAPIKLITDLRLRFLAVIDVNLASDSEEIRSLTAKILCIVLQKTFEPIFMTQTLDKHFLKKLHGLLSLDDQGSTEADLILLTFKETLKEQAPELKLEDKIIRLCNQAEQQGQKLSIAQARLLAAVASKIGANMFKKKNCTTILNKLMSELSIDELVAGDEKRIQEVLITFSEVISQALDTEVTLVNEQIIAEFYGQCEKRDRLGFYVDFISYYCTNAKVNYEKFAKMYMENVLALMNSQDDKLVDKVVKGFSAIINGLQKENQFTMIPLIKELIENIGVERIRVGSLSMEERPLYKKRVASIKMLEKTEGVKSLSAVIQNSITHGSIECRIDSAICFQYLLDFSSPAAIKMEVIKICGALIRVVNDKFPPTLKLQIFHALKLILLRASANAKAMAPQLQTTFLKAFNDSQASEAVRKEVVGCLIEFMKIALKVDPIVKELTTMIEGDKLDQIAKIEASEILALILRNNGKTIQQSMSAQIQTSLMSILQSKPGTHNDKTLANCAVALAFLAAYASDPQQQVTLFDAFDATLVLPVSFGVKFGVLCNGASSALWEKLLPNLEAHLKDMLKDMTGIEEVDDKYSEDGSEEDGGRLHGALEIIGHISDIFVRRFTQPTDPLYTLQFKVINESGLFEKLNAQSGVSRQTVEQVLFYLQSIPVKTAQPDTLDAELAKVIGNGMAFINQFYLEFSSKKVTTPAVLNLAQSNFDGWLNVNDDAKLHNVTVASVKQIVNRECYKAVLSENVRMLTVELAFI